MVEDIVTLAESYGPDDWRQFIREIQFSRPGEFFLFEHDAATGMSEPDQINPEYLQSLRKPVKPPQVNARSIMDVTAWPTARPPARPSAARYAPTQSQAGVDLAVAARTS
jgi:hypothetical protein